MEENESPKYANVDLKVREAQVKLLYRQTWTGLVGVLIVAITACVVLWNVVPQWKLSLWLGTSVFLTIARCYIVIAFHRTLHTKHDIDRWATLHFFGVVASGIMWAIPSIFLWPIENSVYQLVWPILILPLSAAAVATYYTWTLSYLSFVVITVVPISIRFFVEGGHLFNILGFLALFFIAVLLRAGREMHTDSLRAFEFGIRNEALNKNLREGVTKREQLNAQLRKEIKERKLSENELNKRNQELVGLNEELTSTKFNLESSNRKLEEAIANIKQLSGMLPICASCKKIRNDSGYWEILESYLKEHSDVMFSHSICPDCAMELYPEFYNKK